MDIGASTHGVMHVTHAYDRANPSRTMKEEAARRVAGGEKNGGKPRCTGRAPAQSWSLPFPASHCAAVRSDM